MAIVVTPNRYSVPSICRDHVLNGICSAVVSSIASSPRGVFQLDVPVFSALVLDGDVPSLVSASLDEYYSSGVPGIEGECGICRVRGCEMVSAVKLLRGAGWIVYRLPLPDGLGGWSYLFADRALLGKPEMFGFEDGFEPFID
ncbi:MAG: hypothetical protein J6Y37_11530 [Paludibacteraceae bacterium]|nr:hypothetical protein [Paludibacteraceae bacterium]